MERSDEDAFTGFVAETGGRLARIAYLLVGGDRTAGEDLLQGALERTYRHWSRVIRAGDAEAYVRRALVNAAINRRRRRFREEPLEAAGPDGPVDRIDLGGSSAARDEIVRALRTLPARQRAVVVLRYLDDLSEAETAAVLGCAVGSVKSQASRGLARMRAQMTSGDVAGDGDGSTRPTGRTR
ncbi:MAG: SigE family RNA polymerase sigma factor [Frankia sp.]